MDMERRNRRARFANTMAANLDLEFQEDEALEGDQDLEEDESMEDDALF
jgi:hypothetical protein